MPDSAVADKMETAAPEGDVAPGTGTGGGGGGGSSQVTLHKDHCCCREILDEFPD